MNIWCYDYECDGNHIPVYESVVVDECDDVVFFVKDRGEKYTEEYLSTHPEHSRVLIQVR